MEGLIWAVPRDLLNLGPGLTVRSRVGLMPKVKLDPSPGDRSKAHLLQDLDPGDL